MSNNKDLQLNEVFNVKEKVALVTGGGSGIGLMITQTLAVNGAKVYIVGRTEEKLERVVEHHGKDIAGEIIPIVGDVASKEGVQYVPSTRSSKTTLLSSKSIADPLLGKLSRKSNPAKNASAYSSTMQALPHPRPPHRQKRPKNSARTSSTRPQSKSGLTSTPPMS